jgi:hypothetical protein
MNIEMNNELLMFESELDEKAVNYILAVLENPTSDKAKSIANEILSIVLREDLSILKIEATGNVGLALKFMLDLDHIYGHFSVSIIDFLVSNIALLSYYLMTNCMVNPQYKANPLYHIHRASLIYTKTKTFHKVYEGIAKVNKSMVNDFHNSSSMILMLIFKDLHPYREFDEPTRLFYLHLSADIFYIKNVNIVAEFPANALDIHKILSFGVKDLLTKRLKTFFRNSQSEI